MKAASTLIFTLCTIMSLCAADNDATLENPFVQRIEEARKLVSYSPLSNAFTHPDHCGLMGTKLGWGPFEMGTFIEKLKAKFAANNPPQAAMFDVMAMQLAQDFPVSDDEGERAEQIQYYREYGKSERARFESKGESFTNFADLIAPGITDEA